jgi:hypothetical protein
MIHDDPHGPGEVRHEESMVIQLSKGRRTCTRYPPATPPGLSATVRLWHSDARHTNRCNRRRSRAGLGNQGHAPHGPRAATRSRARDGSCGAFIKALAAHVDDDHFLEVFSHQWPKLPLAIARRWHQKRPESGGGTRRTTPGSCLQILGPAAGSLGQHDPCRILFSILARISGRTSLGMH